MGTGIPPLADFAAGKTYDVQFDADGDSLPSPGDTLRYTIKVNNINRVPVSDVRLQDILPQDTTYVLGSQVFRRPKRIQVEEHTISLSKN